MHVLLTGATGYLGSRVAQALMRRGHRVTAAVRDEAAAARAIDGGISATTIAALENGDLLATAAVSCDVLIHTAFGHGHEFTEQVDVERRAIAAVAGRLRGTGKSVIVSTANGVLGDTGAEPAGDDHAGNPSFPAAIRCGVERLVLDPAAGIRGIVIRPAILVHGHGLGQFVPLLVDTARREGVSAYLGEGLNRISAVHVDDLAELYVLALEHAPAGAVYNTAECVPAATMREMAEAIAAGIGDRCGAESVDSERATALWGGFPAFLLGLNNQVTAARAREELGWRVGLDTPSLLDDLSRGSYRQGADTARLSAKMAATR